MFPSYRGKWIPDTPAQRKLVLERLRDWFPFSNSSPVEGIVEAIRTYYASGRASACTCSATSSPVRPIDSVVTHGRPDQPRGQHRRAPGAHPRARLPGAARRTAVHQHPLRDADARAVRAERRHVRRAERAGQLPRAERDRATMRRMNRCPGICTSTQAPAPRVMAWLAAGRCSRAAARREFEAQPSIPTPLIEKIPVVVGVLHAAPSSARRCTRRSARAATTRSASARRSPTGFMRMMDAMFKRVVPVRRAGRRRAHRPGDPRRARAGARGLRVRHADATRARGVRRQPQVPGQRLPAGRPARSTRWTFTGYGARLSSSMLGSGTDALQESTAARDARRCRQARYRVPRAGDRARTAARAARRCARGAGRSGAATALRNQPPEVDGSGAGVDPGAGGSVVAGGGACGGGACAAGFVVAGDAGASSPEASSSFSTST